MKVSNIPFRFFGPIEESAVADLLEDTLNSGDDGRTEDVIRLFCLGEIEPREMAYEIQRILESNYLRRKNAEPEGLEGKKFEPEYAGEEHA